MVTSTNFKEIEKYPGEHNHNDEKTYISMEKFRQKIKRDTKLDPTNLLRNIYDNALEQSTSVVPDYRSIKSSLYRARAKKVPRTPTNMSEVSITGKWRLTLKKERFLLANDVDCDVTIFASDKNLTLLFNSEAIFADGTFKACPPPFEQLYVLYGLYEERCLPLVFGLLSGKSACQYRKFFKIISKKIHRLTGHKWVLQQIVTDYERGVISALESDFAETEHLGCYFHFTQSIFRHLTELGLKKSYSRDPGLKKMVIS